MNFITKLSCLLFLIIIVLDFPAVGQNYNPPFPRTVYQSPNGTSGGAADYFFAQYDLAIHGLRNENAQAFNDSIRVVKPDILIFGTSEQGVWPGPNDPPEMFMFCAAFLTLTDTASVGDSALTINAVNDYNHPERHNYALLGDDDWITYSSIDSSGMYGIPSSGFYAVNTNHFIGDSIRFPNRMSGLGMTHNITSLAPMVDGKEAWKWFIDDRFSEQNFSLFDGVFYDAYRVNFWQEDFETEGGAGVDLNRNMISDFDEFGNAAGLEWINDRWQEGVEPMLQYEHEQFSALHSPDKPSIVVLNTGAAEDNYALDVCEGMLWEGFMRFATNWQSTMQVNRQWDQKMAERGITNFTMIIDYEKESRPSGKDQFNRMRYGLTTALLSGCFYGRTFGDYYYMTYYHDEFDTDLGYPTSEPQELSSGAWIRFFTKGAAICNPTGQVITVSSSELTGMTGYDGPYYRFRGGQTPNFNNGSLFDDSVELYGETRDREKDNQGDGILLFTDSVTVVADIWIGNTYNNDTSPGNLPVELHGEWHEILDKQDDEIHPWGDGNPCFSQWNREPIGDAHFNDGIGYAYAYGGDGSATATFKPNIGVAGYYEIAEWHGKLTPHDPYETQAEFWVSDTLHTYLAINQFENLGQWNKLAIAKLDSGTSNFLRINNNAPSYVLADAIRFRYLGDVLPDSTAPSMPQNIQSTRP
jgi:hypothetical protein